MKKLKFKTYPQLKRELDSTFSIFIRQRDSKEGLNRCFTCGRWIPIKELQCGHYISRTYIGTRWNEVNCQPQCKSCNIFHQGRADEFALALVQKYGEQILEKLSWQKRGGKMSAGDIKLLIDNYKTQLKPLK